MMKRSLINRVISVAFILLLGCLPTRGIQAAEQTVDVQEIVFSHIQDAYTWHITEWNEKEISIPLPIIVKGEQGWDCFLSSRLHGGQTYHNYYIASEGEYAGKVVTKNQAGEEVRPLDFSLTKNVCGLFLGCAVLLTIILSTAKWYQRHPNQVPKGIVFRLCRIADNHSFNGQMVSKASESSAERICRYDRGRRSVYSR